MFRPICCSGKQRLRFAFHFHHLRHFLAIRRVLSKVHRFASLTSLRTGEFLYSHCQKDGDVSKSPKRPCFSLIKIEELVGL